MIEMSVAGRDIVLNPDTEIQIELKNPMIGDGIEDSFSLPVTIPVKGNEINFRHPEQVANNQRLTKFSHVRLGVDGTNLHEGDLLLLGSTDRNLNTSFGVDAFAIRLKGKKLPDLLKDVSITVEQDDEGIAAPIGYRTPYADGGDCQFPVHYNPSIYGDANPAFFPSVQKWNNTSHYNVNDLVSWSTPSFEGIKDEFRDVYQCVLPNTNILPGNFSYWRKASFGLVNSWDCVDQAYRRNNSSLNYYPLVPWFYTKWVIKRAMQTLGFRAEGTFLADHATDELLLPNACTLDKVADPVGDVMFRVADTSLTPFIDHPSFRIHGGEETGGPLQDIHDLWDNVEHTFIPNQAGTWKFDIYVKWGESNPSATSLNNRFFKVQRADGTVKAEFDGPSGVMSEYTNYPLALHYYAPTDEYKHYFIRSVRAQFSITIGADEVNQPLHLNYAANNVYFGEYTWFPDDVFGIYLESSITGWLDQPVMDVVLPSPSVQVHRHVPDVDVAEFLNALADAFNLAITPNLRDSTIRFDYRSTDTGPCPDHTHRLNGPVAFNFDQGIRGRRYIWDLDDKVKEEVPEGATITPIVDFFIASPMQSGGYVLALNTRILYKGVFNNGNYRWKQLGYYFPDVIVGDPDKAQDVKPDMKPLLMRQTWSESFGLLVPVFDHPGKSAFYSIDNPLVDMGMCLFSRQSPRLCLATPQFNYPAGISCGYAFYPNKSTAIDLSFQEEESPTSAHLPPTLYAHAHKRWAETLITAESVTMDLRVDLPFLLGKDWHRPLLIDHQRYLVQTLPVTYSNNHGTQMAAGTRALRLRDGVPTMTE